MSNKGDFLSGFSGGNTQKPLTDNNSKPVKEAKPPEKETPQKDANKIVTAKDLAENKKIADKIVADAQKKDGKAPTTPRPSTTATRPAQSANAIIKAPEHVVTKDETFHKRQITKYVIIGVVVVVLSVLGFFIYQMSTRFEVPDFVGEEFRSTRIDSWQFQHTILNTVEEYDLEFDSGYIIDQSHEAGVRVSGGTIITVTISLGPNMNEVVSLPDFETMTRAEIGTWRDANRMRSITITPENHPYIEQNHVTRVEFASTADPANFRRNDSVTIFVSNGPETISIGNLVGDDPEDVAKFIADNPQIVVETEYEPHPTVDRGYVLRQSVAPNTRIAVGETLVLTLSAGMPVEVPNFANMRRREALDMQEDPTAELEVTVDQRWNATIPYGRFVSQSVDAGTEVYGEGRRITVVYSKGRPWIPRWSSESEIESALVLINDDGAFIIVHFNYIDHWAERGSVVRQSHYGQRVSLNQEITVDISRGNREEPTEPPMEMPPGNGDDD